MTGRTYRYGYHTTRLTLDAMNARPAWHQVHPEMRRRLIALFDMSQDAGREVGFGEGFRSTAWQTQVFLERHYETATGGCCQWNGRRWQLRQGMAHAAPPGRSYHEETTSDGWCLAADLVGDLNWMNQHAHVFGLVHFRNVNNEPWHVQPVEVPRSRSNYTGQPLGLFLLPGHAAPTDPGPPPIGGSDMLYTPLQARVLDTRDRPSPPGQKATIVVAPHPSLPDDAKAVAINVTATNAPGANFITAWPSGNRPLVSFLNTDRVGQTIAGFTIVPLAQDRTFRLYTENGGHLICDLVGYYR